MSARKAWPEAEDKIWDGFKSLLGAEDNRRQNKQPL
jgi:hypothetical protein